VIARPLDPTYRKPVLLPPWRVIHCVLMAV
jgi:hypothetical protein